MATIFYSWQSDTPNNINRGFIKDALEKALKKIAESVKLEEALRLDHDTKGVPGSPEIANTILEKIDNCSVFVPDLTIIARTKTEEQIPNSNVLLEYGYALKSCGDERIVPIMNEAYGYAKDSLPFDLQHRRWPISYYLPKDSTDEARKKEKEILVGQLEEALRTIIEAGLLERKPENQIRLNSSTYMMPMLSRYAQIMLKEASLDEQGSIMYIDYDQGTIIETNKKNLITKNTPREVAKWKAALNELVFSELIVDSNGYEGKSFEVTDLGYKVADTIGI